MTIAERKLMSIASRFGPDLVGHGWSLPGKNCCPCCYPRPLGLQANVDTPAVYEPVAPTIDQARANILIARQLQFTHFRDLGISDELSGDVFDAYLELPGWPARIPDTGRHRQTQSKIRTQLGSALKTGQLQPGFDIYNLVQQRIIERLEFALGNLIDNGIDKLDFWANERILVDRSEADWEPDSQGTGRPLGETHQERSAGATPERC